MSGTVPNKVAIEDGESLFGYMTRVVEANGYGSVTWLLDGHWRGNHYDTGVWRDPEIGRLAGLTGIDADEIRKRIYPVGRDPENRVFFGCELPRTLIMQSGQKSRRRFCPLCIEEDVHHSIFDFKVVSVCPKHGCATTDRCTHCGTIVLWGAPNLKSCRACGDSLTTPTAQVADRTVLRGLRATLRLIVPAHIDPGAEPLPEDLSHLTAPEAIELMTGLANYLGDRPSRTDFLGFDEDALARAHLILDKGWSYVRRWPDGLEAFLLDLRLFLGTDDCAFGAHATYGRFYTTIREATAEPWITVKQVFLDHLEKRWRGNALPARIERSTKTAPMVFRSRSVTLAEAARQLGRSESKVHTLISLGVLKTERSGDWWGAPLFIAREEIEKIAPGGRKPLRMDEVGARLGLSRQRQRQLLEGGIITPVFGPSIDGSKIYLFRDDVDEILAEIYAHLAAGPAETRTKKFSDVMKGARMRKIPHAPVFRAIRTGRLPPISIDPEKVGLAALTFDAKTTVRVLVELEADERAKSDGYLSVPIVARRFGIASMAVAAMVQEGHLTSCSLEGGLKIATEVVEKFEKRFTFLSAASKQRGTSARWLRVALLKAGLPFIDCGSGCGKTSFIERTTLEDLTS